jgi:hypothetical protein
LRAQGRDPIKDWSLTSLKEKIVSHGRYVAFQMAGSQRASSFLL